MRFEEIAKELSEQEGKPVSVYAVRFTFYRALKKLKRYLEENPDLKKDIEIMLEEEYSVESPVNDLLDYVLKYSNE